MQASPLWSIGGGVVFALLLLAVLMFLPHRSWHAELGPVLAVAAAIFVVVSHVHALTQRRVGGVVGFAADGIRWNGKRLLRHGELVGAVSYTNGEHHGIQLLGRWRTVSLELATRGEADEILAEQRLDRGKVTLRPRSHAGLALLLNAIVLVQPTLTGNGLLRLWTGGCFLAVFFVTAVLSYGRVVVGSDGIRIFRFGRRARFIRHADIAAVDVNAGSVTLALHAGTAVRIACSDDRATTAMPVVGAHALAARIRKEQQRALALAGDGALASLLTRGGRAVSAWIADVRHLEDAHADFRGPAVSRDRLWATVEDPSEVPSVRAAAAVVLRAHADEADRARLRVSADASASPRLRAPLQAVVSADDEALADALLACEEEDARWAPSLALHR